MCVLPPFGREPLPVPGLTTELFLVLTFDMIIFLAKLFEMPLYIGGFYVTQYSPCVKRLMLLFVFCAFFDNFQFADRADLGQSAHHRWLDA